MKKLIAKLLILITLVTFIIPKFSFATETPNSETDEDRYNKYKNLTEEGVANVNGRLEKLRDTNTGSDFIATVLSLVSSGIAEAARAVLTLCVNEGDTTHETKITIAGMISDEYPILNNDFLLNKTGTSGSGTTRESASNEAIKEQVAGWYYAIRNLAIIISLFVLIYIGIRMAISTLADDKAKYKKMLIGWIQSFILIFLLHYIMIVAMAIQRVLMDILKPLMPSTIPPENVILGSSLDVIIHGTGWNIVGGAVIYWILTYYQIKFFFLYAKRMVSTAFLMIIAPLITVTYSIDKVSDGKAQAFDAWFKEFVVNIFIQPVHIVIYLVFIVSASEIATRVPLFTMIFFGALSRGEKIIKGVFGMRGRKSINSLGKHK